MTLMCPLSLFSHGLLHSKNRGNAFSRQNRIYRGDCYRTTSLKSGYPPSSHRPASRRTFIIECDHREAMKRENGVVVATAILWAGEIVAMTVLLAGTEYILPAVIILAGGGAVNILIIAGTRQRTTV